ncbi:MAG: sulfite exporter TauE/SafE family protein [Propionibacteriaceae bacterium]|nr:sulfite exporter TauE/SafE family protein [Propionibacteriaceae bacterium]
MLSARATGGNLVFVVLLGVAASISTCMALVGGIVLSLSSSFAQSYPQASGRKLLRPQLMFNAGRIVGFAVLGALIGLVGQVVSLQGVWLGAMMLLVALVMGWLGLRLTGISPKLSAVSLTLSPALTKWVFTEGGGYRDTNALLLGAASFFLPCGFTQAVQVYALSTGDWLQAGLVMALFAVGTTPGLLGVGALSALAEGEKATRVFHFVGVAVIGFAVLNFVAGIHAIAPNVGAPNVAAPPAQVATSVTPSAIPTGDGFQQVTTTVAAGYSPADAVVQAGVPVKWTLDVQALGCASTISAAQLGIAEPIYLDVGTNSVEFTLSQPGTYQYSCAMGMYWGSFTAV